MTKAYFDIIGDNISVRQIFDLLETFVFASDLKDYGIIDDKITYFTILNLMHVT